MQSFFNKKFRNRFTDSEFVDTYLANEANGKNDELRSFGVDVYPRDENDIFVPITKNTPRNLEMVEHTMHDAYGHTVK